jgi:uncharacterized membrane protein YdbT with pleckstrin-like domain
MSGANPTPPGAPGGSWRRRGRVVPKQVQAPPPRRATFIYRDLNPGERVVWIRRQSLLYLVATAAPMVLLALVLFLASMWLGAALPSIVYLIGLGLLVLLTGRWLIMDVWRWFFQFYVLTNHRVLRSQGYFVRHREEIPLKSVAQVRVERPNIFFMMLGIGNVVVRPIGPEIALDGMAFPRDVGDSIMAMQEDPSFGLPPHETPQPDPVPSVKSQRVQGAINRLAEPAAMPGVPAPIVRAPFLSFLHRKIPIKFISGESVVEVVYRHWIILLRNELIAIAIVLISILASIGMTAARIPGGVPIEVAGAGIVIGGGLGILIYMNWADDVFVLTTHRVIDIDRLVFILSEYSKDAPYARIQEVRVRRNLLGRILGYGSIVVDTAGRKAPMEMANIGDAYGVMDRIFGQINLLRDREQVQALNKQKQENHKWLATVLNELVVSVPDVRGRSVVFAASELRKVGLKLTVEAERPTRTQAAGTVLEQVPGPGTSALADAEVRVVLAGNPIAAVP